jgi:uncharacterized membrane protein
MMNRDSTVNARRIALAGVMAALIWVLTAIPKIPTPVGGYVHLGDVGLVFAALAFGPVVGAAAGGIGTMLADLTAGYTAWAPFTLVIHGLMGAVIGYAALRWPPKLDEPGSRVNWPALVSLLAAVILLAVGYFIAGSVITGSPAQAAVEIGPNLLQGAVGAVVGGALYAAVVRAYPALRQNNDFPENGSA